MGKIYVGQSNLTLYIETGSNLLNASSVIIEGTDPSGNSINTINGTIEDSTKGIISFIVYSTTFSIAGTYILWTKANYVGGTLAYGEPFHLNVYAVGT